MPKFIKLTEFSAGVEVYVNIDMIFDFHRPQGMDRTTIKSLTLHEHVRETPEEILAAIDAAIESARR